MTSSWNIDLVLRHVGGLCTCAARPRNFFPKVITKDDPYVSLKGGSDRKDLRIDVDSIYMGVCAKGVFCESKIWSLCNKKLLLTRHDPRCFFMSGCYVYNDSLVNSVTILYLFQILQCMMILTCCVDLTAGLVHHCTMPLSRRQGDVLGIVTLVSNNYRQFSNTRRTQSPTINVSRLVLQLSLSHPLKPGVQLRMKM